jgi:hypothetical protein
MIKFLLRYQYIFIVFTIAGGRAPVFFVLFSPESTEKNKEEPQKQDNTKEKKDIIMNFKDDIFIKTQNKEWSLIKTKTSIMNNIYKYDGANLKKKDKTSNINNDTLKNQTSKSCYINNSDPHSWYGKFLLGQIYKEVLSYNSYNCLEKESKDKILNYDNHVSQYKKLKNNTSYKSDYKHIYNFSHIQSNVCNIKGAFQKDVHNENNPFTTEKNKKIFQYNIQKITNENKKKYNNVILSCESKDSILTSNKDLQKNKNFLEKLLLNTNEKQKKKQSKVLHFLKEILKKIIKKQYNKFLNNKDYPLSENTNIEKSSDYFFFKGFYSLLKVEPIGFGGEYLLFFDIIKYILTESLKESLEGSFNINMFKMNDFNIEKMFYPSIQEGINKVLTIQTLEGKKESTDYDKQEYIKYCIDILSTRGSVTKKKKEIIETESSLEEMQKYLLGRVDFIKTFNYIKKEKNDSYEFFSQKVFQKTRNIIEEIIFKKDTDSQSIIDIQSHLREEYEKGFPFFITENKLLFKTKNRLTEYYSTHYWWTGCLDINLCEFWNFFYSKIIPSQGAPFSEDLLLRGKYLQDNFDQLKEVTKNYISILENSIENFEKMIQERKNINNEKSERSQQELNLKNLQKKDPLETDSNKELKERHTKNKKLENLIIDEKLIINDWSKMLEDYNSQLIHHEKTLKSLEKKDPNNIKSFNKMLSLEERGCICEEYNEKLKERDNNEEKEKRILFLFLFQDFLKEVHISAAVHSLLSIKRYNKDDISYIDKNQREKEKVKGFFTDYFSVISKHYIQEIFFKSYKKIKKESKDFSNNQESYSHSIIDNSITSKKSFSSSVINGTEDNEESIISKKADLFFYAVALVSGEKIDLINVQDKFETSILKNIKKTFQ